MSRVAVLSVAASLVAAVAAVAALAEPGSRSEGVASFETVRAVLQHPRCQNCHIPGEAPLQLDRGRAHTMGVVRGPDGSGVPGLACSACHGEQNAPASYGAHVPPGAPGWKLPPPEHKMVFIGLKGGQLCRQLKDPRENGGKDLAALVDHVSRDKLVLWGWNPGAGRRPVPIPHARFVAAFKAWVAAGAPCPP